jgi:hypothetical protein
MTMAMMMAMTDPTPQSTWSETASLDERHRGARSQDLDEDGEREDRSSDGFPWGVRCLPPQGTLALVPSGSRSRSGTWRRAAA